MEYRIGKELSIENKRRKNQINLKFQQNKADQICRELLKLPKIGKKVDFQLIKLAETQKKISILEAEAKEIEVKEKEHAEKGIKQL